MTEHLATWSSRRPWPAVAIWLVALVASIAITATFLGDALSGDEENTSDTESRRADDLRFERLAAERGRPQRGVSEVVVVRSATATVDEPRFERRVRALAAELQQAGATGVTSFYDAGERRLVSDDRDATAMLVTLSRDAEDDIDDVVEAVQSPHGRDGFDTAITGEFTLDDDFSTLAGEDLQNGELGFALLALLGQALPLSVFATNMLTGMGLALGIDYSLFGLSRYREERLHEHER